MKMLYLIDDPDKLVANKQYSVTITVTSIKPAKRWKLSASLLGLV